MLAWLTHWYALLDHWDQALQSTLPALLRLLLWPSLAAAVAWLLYRLSLPREKIKEWQLELMFQNQLRRTFRQLGSRWLGNPWRRRRLALLVHGLRPFVTGVALLLFASVLLWLPQRFAWRPLGAGTSLVLSPLPADAALLSQASQAQAKPAQRVFWSDKLQAWTLLWPAQGERVRFSSARGQLWFELGAQDPGSSISQPAWWHGLWRSAQLQPAAPFERVSIERRPQLYLPWGPLWLRTWWFPPLALALISAMGWAWYRWRKPEQRPFFARIRPRPEETPAELQLPKRALPGNTQVAKH